MSRPAVFVDGMKGLGDGIYQRPFLRALAVWSEVWLATPWPELYRDLPIKVVRSETRLRTQAKNIARSAADWQEAPAGARRIKVGYGHGELSRGSIVKAMERVMPLQGRPFVFDLPAFGPSPVTTDKPIALVRPVTVRSEWRNEARNPLPQYLATVVAALRPQYHVVSVADLAGVEEWAVPPLPRADTVLHRGELGVTELLALLQHAALVIGGVGWIVPASIAAGVPAFVILGGQGGHNGPERLTDPRMDLSQLGWARPDRFCRCGFKRHACDKRIGDVEAQFQRWRDARGI